MDTSTKNLNRLLAGIAPAPFQLETRPEITVFDAKGDPIADCQWSGSSDAANAELFTMAPDLAKEVITLREQLEALKANSVETA